MFHRTSLFLFLYLPARLKQHQRRDSYYKSPLTNFVATYPGGIWISLARAGFAIWRTKVSGTRTPPTNMQTLKLLLVIHRWRQEQFPLCMAWWVIFGLIGPAINSFTTLKIDAMGFSAPMRILTTTMESTPLSGSPQPMAAHRAPY